MFTREDAILIHHGLEERHSRLASSTSASFAIAGSGGIPAGERSLPVP